ncbi:MAG TPA: DUF3617 domain-containing protein [Allosphingosinicella sp.]|jgi:hypothetical protein|uniref:DUF3617 domain-containing protein n=1 Tax=Allosphingosinicella sp. TaxID=2823234 RepID=UPI002F2AC1DA
MRSLFIAAALVGLVACNSSSEQPKGDMTAEQVAEELKDMEIEPGQWEATNEILSVNAPNVPGDVLKQMVGKKTTVSNCITPEQAAKPSANFLAAQQNNQCTYQDWSMESGRMTGTMTCQGGQTPGKVVMIMSGAYGSTRYDLDMDMKTTGLPGGMVMNIKAKTTGRRTGECTAT